MILIALPQTEGGLADIQRIARRCPGRTFLGAAPRYDGQDQPRFDRLAALSQQCGAPLVAMGDVLMHRAARRRLADVLTCLREGITIDRIGQARPAQCRAPPEKPGRDGAAVPPLPRRPAPHAGDRRPLRLQPVGAAL